MAAIEQLGRHEALIAASGDATIGPIDTKRFDQLRLTGQVTSGTGVLQIDVQWQDDGGIELATDEDVMAALDDGIAADLTVRGTQALITLSETGAANSVTPRIAAFGVKT